MDPQPYHDIVVKALKIVYTYEVLAFSPTLLAPLRVISARAIVTDRFDRFTYLGYFGP